jgi:NAD+ synthase (glutamine-hydrolysing)
MRRVRVGLAQVNPTVGAVEANARLVGAGMDRARALGCDLVAFPELVLTGYPPEDLLFKPAFIEANLRALADITRASRGLTAVVGFVDKRDDIFNAAAVLHDGANAGTYHKQYLPNYGVFDENRYFQSGTESPVFTLGETVIAANICEDIWYPTGPTTRQALGGAELVVSINASPYHAGKGRFREKMLATRASDDLVCLAFVNAVGGQDELVFDGQSFIFNEKGEVVARGKVFEEDFVVADLDLDEVFRARLHDSRRRKEKLRASETPPRRVALPARPSPEKPKVPAHEVRMLEPVDEIYHALVLGTRDYVTKNGFSHVVLGLSGGIDSSLVAAIACDALGAANVTGVTMPSPFSSAGTRGDAGRLARNLGIDFLRLPITPVLAAYRRALAKPFKGLKEDVTEENLQARIRGNYLMALSNKFGWLVLTTGNKSEIGVGYSTLYGDMAGGFAVIKDVPKTLVYQVCEHVNRRAGRDVIPRSVFERPPSAELRHEQTDQDTLPPYPTLDAILEAYVEADQGLADIAARGFDAATVKRVIAMVDRNEYKRRQGPIGIKITPRAFGKDWRLPIVNRFRE